MTTITIENVKGLSKTQFKDLEDLLNWAGNYFIEKAPLSEEIIKKYEEAKKEKDSPTSSFQEAL
jgi:hypothetical protein